MEESSQEKELLSNQEKKEKYVLHLLLHTLLYMAILLSGITLIQRYFIQPVQVSGSSMEPTLDDGDHLLLEKLSYRFSKPQRFDVIVFTPYEDQPELFYIKRILALPGEQVTISDNHIYINGKKLEEYYGMDSIIQKEGIAKYGITLGKDEYFVLGDNRNCSKDSRDESVGLVSEQSILGKAICCIWPLNQVSIIRH